MFALAGGAVPLPLTVLQLLAFDVGTETLPSLALGRDPAEPGIMNRPPRQPIGRRHPRADAGAGVAVPGADRRGPVDGGLLLRPDAGGLAPRRRRRRTDSRFTIAYLQATTMTFLGMIFGQIGTAFAVRTQRASLRSVGVFSNRYLLLGIAGELLLAAVFVFAPPLQSLLGTACPPARDLLLLLPFPLIVWGADELRRYLIRSRTPATRAAVAPATAA